MNLERYTGNVEVHPVTEWPDENGQLICETCDGNEAEASFWSVYLHLHWGGVECVADCPDEEIATFVAGALRAELRTKLEVQAS